MRVLCAVASGLMAASLAFGQGTTPAAPAATKLEFEVASVKPSQNTGPDRVTAGLRMDGSQAHIGALSLKNLITMAYRVESNQITGPGWISQLRFDVDAKLPDGATTQQIPEMLQSLLEERFALKLHQETKDAPAYALVMGKAPLTLKEAPQDAQAAQPSGSVNVAVQGSAAGVSIDLGNGSSYTFANNEFDFKKISMDRTATELARYLDRPVVNLTGLKGAYGFALPVTQEDYRLLLIRSAVNAGMVLPPQAIAYMESSSPVSLFEAVDHVGLHLDARKMPLDLIVVDSALQTPTDN
jgi:uncharacterized protein (TIGR03435 family)